MDKTYGTGAKTLKLPARLHREQAPATQAVEPLALEQAFPQPPQLATVVIDVSQPLAGLASQLANPALHAPS